MSTSPRYMTHIAAQVGYDADGNPWRLRAACRGKDEAVFLATPGSTNMLRDAKAICAGCPVRVDCLEDAVAIGEFGSIRGGLTGAEVRAEWRRRNPDRSRMHSGLRVASPVVLTDEQRRSRSRDAVQARADMLAHMIAEGRSRREMVEATGLSMAAVGNHITRARQAARDAAEAVA